ncbi:MAG: hypothetical protein U1C96_12570 [Gallionella sp.]|nr:hypothetical protein [Gallionella sp.]
MSEPEQEIVEYKVRRAAGVQALREIGKIVAEDRRAEAGKARILRWFMRYGWLLALGISLLSAYWMGVI